MASLEFQSGLVRAIGRWTLAGLVLNSAIGSGIFGLPALVSEHVGRAGPLAYLLGAVGMAVIMACFAEVGSQFREAGGPYLYAREAFGRFAGIQIAWVAWLVRLTAAAANTNLFAVYLAEFWPAAAHGGGRFLAITMVLVIPAAINYRGVKSGARMSNILVFAKLAPLTFAALLGLVFFRGGLSTISLPPGEMLSSSSLHAWMDAILVTVYAFGGFEVGLFPMGEAKAPRRDVPFALLVAFLVMLVLYVLVQVGVQAGLAQPEHSPRPLADAAGVLVGRWGAVFIAIGALLSIYGYLSAMMLNVPRLTYALASLKDFPSLFGRVHPRFRTPYVSVLVFGILVWGLALAGTFKWNVTLSAVARLLTYGMTCGALIPLRKKIAEPGALRLPAGKWMAIAGLFFSLTLATRMDRVAVSIMGATLLVAAANWFLVRRAS
jgi:APA family basic amino acid/polyamine antiporter